MPYLRWRSLLEPALTSSYSLAPTARGITLKRWARLFECCDRERLRAAGDPLPEGDRFTLYRGVSGRGAARRVAGLSWTRSPGIASHFARTWPLVGLGSGCRTEAPPEADPAVYVTEVRREDVLFYDDGRNEDDFVLIAKRWQRLAELPLAVKPEGLAALQQEGKE